MNFYTKKECFCPKSKLSASLFLNLKNCIVITVVYIVYDDKAENNEILENQK